MQTVLLVDSDILVRHQLAEFLRSCGLRVVEASNADEARVFVGDASLGIDVALVDTSLDRAEGAFALTAWLRQNHPGIDVLTAGSLERAIDRATTLCEEEGTLPKPYDPAAIRDRIARLRARRDSERG